MFDRLKRIWEMGEPKDEEHIYIPETQTSTDDIPQRKLATIVLDDPMDLFPNEDENAETSEPTSTDRTD